MSSTPANSHACMRSWTRHLHSLGDDIVLAHAKDLDHDGAAGHLPAGHGLLDYDLYLKLLHDVGFSGALILHGLAVDQVDECVAFLRGKVAHSPYATS